ncbi:MAG: hypothetical protein Q9170_003450 [Blastenia crenularia]
MLPQIASTTAESERQPDTGPLGFGQPSPFEQSPTSPLPIFQLAGTKRKQQQAPGSVGEAGAEELADVRPSKKARELPPFEVPEETFPNDAEANPDDPQPPPLSEESEEELRTLYKEVMDSAADNAPALKRTSSRRSLVRTESDTVRSQRSNNTTAHYRYKHLERANVHIHVDPPEDIQAAINDIIDVKPSDGRYAILRDKARNFQKRCKEMVRVAAGEDDFVHIFYHVIEELGSADLISCEKADWRVELKPTTQYLGVNLSFLSDADAMGNNELQEVNDSLALPAPKRRQESAGRLHISPQNSQTDPPRDNRPTQADTAKETSLIKTPRPDITTGIKESAIVSALASSLSSQDFSFTETKQFLEELQDATMPGPSLDSVLIIVPTQRQTTLAFPTLISEGKAYSTGKQIFEAENQAAVSGAGGLKIQILLDELVKRATRGSDTSLTSLKDRPPLVFSICTEGPYHELWAHYTVIEDGQRQFSMVLLNVCHGVLLKQVERFLCQVDNVLNWTTGALLDSVVERLEKVARKATVQL